MFSLRLKKKIEKMSELLIFAHFLIFGERCEWSESLILLKSNERYERIAHFAH